MGSTGTADRPSASRRRSITTLLLGVALLVAAVAPATASAQVADQPPPPGTVLAPPTDPTVPSHPVAAEPPSGGPVLVDPGSAWSDEPVVPAGPAPAEPPPLTVAADPGPRDRPDLEAAKGQAPSGSPIAADPDAPADPWGAMTSSATFGRPPVAWRDAPDPAVIRVNDRYYAYTTNANFLRLQVMTSVDLVNWTVLADGLPGVGAWAADNFGMIWAPEVVAVGSGYVLYYTAPDRGSGRQCIGTAFSSSPAGPFTNPWPQPIKCDGSQGGSIDPSVVEHLGQKYLLWKTDGNAIGQPTRIWSERLSDDGRALLGNPSMLLISGAAWEQGIIEGPSMVLDNGRFLLFYSAGRWWEGTYGIGWASCSGPAGPCTKQTTAGPWEQNTGWAVGAGGTDLVRDELGNLWMAYHGWTGAVGYDQGGRRSMFIERITTGGGVPVARNDLQLGGPRDPFGATDSLRSWTPSRIDVSGWAIDLDRGPSQAVAVHVYLDGQFVAATATGSPRADVAASYAGYTTSGFVTSVDVTAGRHTVCVYALNTGLGSTNQGLGCQSVDVAAPAYAPVAAANDDGRLEVFAADALGGLAHAWQVAAGGAWSAWEPVGITTRSSPVVARNGDGRLELFAVDSGGWLVHRWQILGQGWSTWQSMGVQATGTPAVGTNVDGRLELFVARPDGRLLHSWQAPPQGWSAFVDSGASASAPPEMNASADGRLEVFVTSGDGGLLHSWQTRRNGPFSPWRYTGTFARGRPDAERSVDGRLELFVTTPQNQVIHSWQVVTNGAWSGWEWLGLLATDAPTATRNADGRLEVFATSGTGQLTHTWQMPTSATGWSWWESMGISVAQRPAAAMNSDGRLALFAVTTSGMLLQASQVPGTGWSSWRSVKPGSA